MFWAESSKNSCPMFVKTVATGHPAMFYDKVKAGICKVHLDICETGRIYKTCLQICHDIAAKKSHSRTINKYSTHLSANTTSYHGQSRFVRRICVDSMPCWRAGTIAGLRCLDKVAGCWLQDGPVLVPSWFCCFVALWMSGTWAENCCTNA